MAKLKLSRKFQARNRLMRNQLSSLVLFEKITTTEAKAKALKSEAQKLIYKINSSKESYNLIRDLKKSLYGGSVDKAVDIKGQFESVSIVKLNNRFGDGARKAVVVLNKKPAKVEKEEKAGK